MLTAMIECRECYGLGRIHNPGCNGDPMDEGIDCPKCGGTGAIEVDVETGDPIDAAGWPALPDYDVERAKLY